MQEQGPKPLLKTKLFIPKTRHGVVERPHLIQAINAGAQYALTLISAPAGFGKTTALVEWVKQSTLPVAWVSLDEGDNDPARFFLYLISALRNIRLDVGEDALALLQSPQPLPPKSIVLSLLADLEAIPEPFVLVLDDFHAITNPQIQSVFFFLLEHISPSMHVMIATRVDPLIPLARMRSQREMVELRIQDLRFSLDEAICFFNRMMGLPLRPEDVAVLAYRTEGWIAGLQLSGLALQGFTQQQMPGDVRAFIDSFSGDDRYILDYLVEEVLSRLPEEMRTFLLQTSILDRMCGPLCDAVTGLPAGTSQAMLERLEHENLFLVPLDNRRQWYRYHHLFADLLQNKFKILEGSKAKGAAEMLHQRAADWLAAQDLIPDAVEHALNGQVFERAAEWIEGYTQYGIDRGEYTMLISWIKRLPHAILYSRPSLLMHYAWTLFYLGEITNCEQPVAAAELLWREQGNLERLGEALNLRANLARAEGDGKHTAELAQQALELLPESDLHNRGVSWLYLGNGAFLEGRVDEAGEAYNRSIALCKQSGNINGSRLAATQLAQVCVVQGDLLKAARLLEEVVSQTGDLPIYEGLIARMLLGLIWREWNQLEEAEKGLRYVLEMGEKTGQIIYFKLGYLNLSLLLWEKRDQDGMRAALEQQARVTGLVEGNGGRVFGYAVSALQAALLSDPEAARSWRERNKAVLQSPVSFQNEYIYMTLIRLSLGLGTEEAQEAIQWLRPLLRLAQEQRRIQSLSVLWMLKALVHSRLKDPVAAVDALEESLKLAHPGGYRRMYLDEGQPMIHLLSLLIQKPSLSPVLRAYAKELRAAILLLNCASDQTGRSVHEITLSANLQLIDPLTQREVEILRLIAEGKSNGEIAAALYLAVSTVKRHINHIFGKLGVSTRAQAIAMARNQALV